MSRGFDKKFIIFILNFLSGGIRNAELYSPCQLTLTCLRCGDGCRKNIKYFEFLPIAHTVAKPDCNVIFYIFAEFPPSFAVAKRSADMMSCACGGDIIYDEGRAENVPKNYRIALLHLFYILIILLKFPKFCCIIKKERWRFQRPARLLNGVYTGGYALTFIFTGRNAEFMKGGYAYEK